MLDHVTEFIRFRTIPTQLAPTGLDDEDVTFVNVNRKMILAGIPQKLLGNWLSVPRPAGKGVLSKL